MTYTECTRAIEKQLGEGQTDAACAALAELLHNKDAALYQQTLLLTGQYNEIRRNQALGLDDDTHGLNRITHTLIQLCAEVKTTWGKDPIDTATQSRIAAFLATDADNASQKKDPSVSKPSKGIFQQWGWIAAAVVALLLAWQGYKWVSNVFKPTPKDGVTADVQQNSNSTYLNQTASKALNTAASATLSDAPPLLLDFKTSSQTVDIFDTRLFPTDGLNRLVFSGKMFCDASNRGGCNLFNSFFRLKVDGQTLELKTENLTTEHPNGINSGIFRGNAHEFFKLAFDIPANAQSVALEIKIDGTSTAVVDVKKTRPAPPEPAKRVNLTQEMDFNITKNFGNAYQLLSVKAAPYDDNFFKITARVLKPYADVSSSCTRVVMSDNSLRSFDTDKEISENKDVVETEFTFILPRTLGPFSLMVGNCYGQTPFKVALPL